MHHQQLLRTKNTPSRRHVITWARWEKDGRYYCSYLHKIIKHKLIEYLVSAVSWSTVPTQAVGSLVTPACSVLRDIENITRTPFVVWSARKQWQHTGTGVHIKQGTDDVVLVFATACLLCSGILLLLRTSVALYGTLQLRELGGGGTPCISQASIHSPSWRRDL